MNHSFRKCVNYHRIVYFEMIITNTIQVILHLTTGVLDFDSKIAQNTLDLRNKGNHQSFILFLKIIQKSI